MNAVSSTSILGWVRDWVSRSHEPAKGDASRAMSLEHLPVSASVFVIAVVAVGVTVLILQGPRQITHPTEFIALLAASVLASSLRLRLPLGTSASTLLAATTSAASVRAATVFRTAEAGRGRPVPARRAHGSGEPFGT